MTSSLPLSEPAAQRLREFVLSMPIAQTLGLRFLRLEAGGCELEIPYQETWTFRPGQYQATPMFAVADFAGVCAAATLLEVGWQVATVDCTLKIVGPAGAGPLRAAGRVVKASKLLTVSAADVFALGPKGEPALCATALVTARNVPRG